MILKQIAAAIRSSHLPLDVQDANFNWILIGFTITVAAELEGEICMRCNGLDACFMDSTNLFFSPKRVGKVLVDRFRKVPWRLVL